MRDLYVINIGQRKIRQYIPRIRAGIPESGDAIKLLGTEDPRRARTRQLLRGTFSPFALPRAPSSEGNYAFVCAPQRLPPAAVNHKNQFICLYYIIHIYMFNKYVKNERNLLYNWKLMYACVFVPFWLYSLRTFCFFSISFCMLILYFFCKHVSLTFV